MAASAELVALVDKVPPLDGKDYKPPLLRTKPSDGKFTGPTWEEAEKIIDPILKGGRGSIAGVIDMLKDVDDGQDYKARYVLHAMAIYVCRADKQEQQEMFVDAVASQVAGRSAGVRKFLIQQLQHAGSEKVAGALGRMLMDEKVCEEAALALLAIRKGAVEQFRSALPAAKGKCRLTVIQDLGVLGDASSAADLRRAASDSDRAVRIAARWALANIADAGSVDTLIKGSGSKDWERIQAAKACLVLAEKLAAAGKKDEARRVYTHLRDTRTDESESYVRQAAAKALAAI
ncbi:MAG: HEAT repeat domain-containing protein [Phycisphaerae bacterium]